jgi:hypothetical protein
MVISAAFQYLSSEYEVLLLGGLECRFSSKEVRDGFTHYIFDVIKRRTYMNSRIFHKSVKQITLDTLTDLTGEYEKKYIPLEASLAFIERHFPGDYILRHLIDHLMEIPPSVRFSPHEVIKRITRDLTIQEEIPVSNTESESENRLNTRKSKRHKS